jgi:membrane protein DedA with SNARE-associated domain
MQGSNSISSTAGALVQHLGVVGVGVGVFLNGLGVPGLSEVLLPLGGVGVKQGTINFWWLLIACLIAQVAGLTCAYLIARYGGVALVERYGKYVLISRHDLEGAHRAFKRWGGPLVLFGAFIPGIQGFIGYVAGLAEMDFGQFLVAATLGKLVWISGLIGLGMVLEEHLDLIDKSVKQMGVIVLALLIAIGVWHVWRRRRAGREAQQAVKE